MNVVAAAGAGGLSGRPLQRRSLEVLRLLHGHGGQGLTLISAGGLTDASDARERLRSGATLIQGYTGFIYGGPRWPSRIVDGLE